MSLNFKRAAVVHRTSLDAGVERMLVDFGCAWSKLGLTSDRVLAALFPKGSCLS